ncbi:MAG: hypothetical protein M3010_12245, partial [Candidatus Dormibacteraeota bacterium]|nr:hypothetical protein [Candidatus Dormibacteraeota bacterium]
MKEVLERLLSGEFTVEQALLALDASHVAIVGDLARLDPDRARRKGIPEVIFAPGKSPEVTADLAGRMLEASGQALVSRVTAEHDAALTAVRGATIIRYGSSRRLLAPDH